MINKTIKRVQAYVSPETKNLSNFYDKSVSYVAGQLIQEGCLCSE